jgi:hypothetical protein
MRDSCVTFACSLIVCLAADAAVAARDDLRVHSIRPAVFEYVFTSIVSGTGDNARLAFNHRSGKTCFRGIGDKLGDFTIKSVEKKTESVFNETINAHQDKPASIVTLEGPKGNAITLKQNKRISQPGWIATVVSLKNARWARVYEQDVLDLDGTSFVIEAIKAEQIVASENGKLFAIPPLSEDDKTKLVKVRERLAAEREARRRARREAQRLAAKWRKQEETDRLLQESPGVSTYYRPRETVEIKRKPKFFLGSEYPYPVEFQVVPVYRRTPSGKRVPSAVVVPKRFESRQWGINITRE